MERLESIDRVMDARHGDRDVRPLGKNARFQGTLCSIEIQRSAISDFFAELTKKKDEIGIGGHVDGIGRIFDGH